jgi:hypothetical protein
VEYESYLQRSIYKLNVIAMLYSMKISQNKTKILAFSGKNRIRAKIVIDTNVIE